MQIYYFGNKDLPEDNIVFKLIPQLKSEFPDIKFIELDPNEDLFFEEKNPTIIDCMLGIDEVTLITDIDLLKKHSLNSLHDFDLGFNLKLLIKLKKIDSVKIIAIPSGIDLTGIFAQTSEIIRQVIGNKFNQGLISLWLK